MRITLMSLVFASSLALGGCRVPAQITVTPAQVQTILTDAQWGVAAGCAAEWLTATECVVVNTALVQAEYAVQQASAGQNPSTIARSILVKVEATLGADSRLRPYFDAAIVLL